MKKQTVEETKEDARKALEKQARKDIHNGLFTFQLPPKLQKLQKRIEENETEEQEISELDQIINRVFEALPDLLKPDEQKIFLQFIRETLQCNEYMKAIIDLRDLAKKPSIQALVLVFNRDKEDFKIWKEETIIHSWSRLKLENIKIVRG